MQPQAFARPAACAVGPRLCRIQRPIHTHWVATTHRHGTYDSANRPACMVARACAQRGRCRVHTCQCLLRANQRTKQAEPQPRGIHGAHHAQAGRSSTIGCRLGLALAPARALLRTCTCAKDKGQRGVKWPVDGRCADACQSVNFNREDLRSELWNKHNVPCALAAFESRVGMGSHSGTTEKSRKADKGPMRPLL